jgi:hypothetical protein
MLPKGIKKFMPSLMHIEGEPEKASFSPSGVFKMENFRFSKQPDFQAGELGKISKLIIKTDLMELFNSKLLVDSISVEGLNLSLNYKNKKQFNLKSFYETKDGLASKISKFALLIQSAEINKFEIKNSEVNLETDLGLIVLKDINISFKKIAINSNNFIDVISKSGSKLSGKANFTCKIPGFEFPANFDFSYDILNKNLSITDFACKDLSLYGKINIFFFHDGSVSSQIDLKTEMDKNQNFIFGMLGLQENAKSNGNDGNVNVDVNNNYAKPDGPDGNDNKKN